MMELIVDDRECKVIPFLQGIKKERITVGDYAFVYNKRIIMIVERKTLKDLSASIKDGRMSNTKKLMEAQQETKCQLLYIVEGPQYPAMNRKFAGIPFKCLQGMIDSLMFRNNIKVIWTKNCEHTAQRLMKLKSTFEKMILDETFLVYSTPEKIQLSDEVKGAAEEVLKKKPELDVFKVRVDMLSQIKYLSRATATTLLKQYTLQQVLLGELEEKTYRELRYASGYKLGSRGTKIHKELKNIDLQTQIAILSSIPHISSSVAECILKDRPLQTIISGNLDGLGLLSIGAKKLGPARTKRIKDVL